MLYTVEKCWYRNKAVGQLTTSLIVINAGTSTLAQRLKIPRGVLYAVLAANRWMSHSHTCTNAKHLIYEMNFYGYARAPKISYVEQRKGQPLSQLRDLRAIPHKNVYTLYRNANKS